MAKYRDEVEAARLRAATLEAELGERQAEVSERDAALTARDARIQELEAELARRGGAPTEVKPDGPARGTTTAIVVMVALVLLGAVGFFAMGGAADAEVTIGVMQAGRAIEQADIYVDGQKVCDFAPCRIAVANGKVLAVRVVAGEQSASQTITADGDTHVQIGVPAPPPPPPPPPPPLKEPAPAGRCGCAPDDLMCLMRCSKTPARLNINSIPPSTVIVDGSPQGKTPVVGLEVKPGSHAVVFKHPELGTKSRSVSIVAGATKTVSVRFDR
jgi:PEGA domain